jgi:putative hydrolase of the HAD superfamily
LWRILPLFIVIHDLPSGIDHFILSRENNRSVDGTKSGSEIEQSNILQRPVKTLIFDMDNTLFDLYTAKMRACESVVSLLGTGRAEELFAYFLRKVGGFEDPASISDFMIDYSCFDPEHYLECTRLYNQEKLKHIIPYKGVRETLQFLEDAGFCMAVVTDARRPEANTRLRHTGLARFFDPVVTTDLTGFHKPSTLPFLYALMKLGARASETVLIGDSPRRDIAPGVILGMRTVYARYGDRFSMKRGSGGADHAIDDFRDLPGVIGIPGHASGLARY